VGRILIIGGYGAFGARAAERLAREPNLKIVVAGRSPEKAAEYAGRLARTAKTKVAHARMDAMTATPEEISALGAKVLVNASGPFQTKDYGLARACVGARCHYVDLADARTFVTGVTCLDREAKAAGTVVISGASSVPGLSSAVVQEFAGEFKRLDAIDIGISPGNSFDPGMATAASILRQVGRPYTRRSGGRDRIAYGWQGLRRHRFPELGTRFMSNVEVPDLDLLPARYPSLQTVHFTAGAEVGLFHLGLWGLSWLVRARIVRDLGALAPSLLGVKRRLRFLGSDAGGMFVTLRGLNRENQPREISWHLTARRGHGPYVPATPAVIVAKHLISGQGPPAGARPCFGLFTLSEFAAETADLDITCTLERE
jgi:NAD(P)-dependent dehydrogenase (short-subunit alcohol dehydrogenase family)